MWTEPPVKTISRCNTFLTRTLRPAVIVKFDYRSFFCTVPIIPLIIPNNKEYINCLILYLIFFIIYKPSKFYCRWFVYPFLIHLKMFLSTFTKEHPKRLFMKTKDSSKYSKLFNSSHTNKKLPAFYAYLFTSSYKTTKR